MQASVPEHEYLKSLPPPPPTHTQLRACAWTKTRVFDRPSGRVLEAPPRVPRSTAHAWQVFMTKYPAQKRMRFLKAYLAEQA